MSKREFYRFAAAVLVSFVATLAAALVAHFLPPHGPAQAQPANPIPFPGAKP